MKNSQRKNKLKALSQISQSFIKFLFFTALSATIRDSPNALGEFIAQNW
jgi:hypothetical protein